MRRALLAALVVAVIVGAVLAGGFGLITWPWAVTGAVLALGALTIVLIGATRPNTMERGEQHAINFPFRLDRHNGPHEWQAAMDIEELASAQHPLAAALGAYTDRAREGLPFGGRTDPLPHDGLFLRRNNAFGTRLALGIGDLIDQGVLVEQEQIRFDDFIAGNIDDIPAPVDGSALVVRHGWTAALGDNKAHEPTTHFLEIALRAADAPIGGHAKSAPLPVNIVFVVDVSGSMSGEKIDSVKSAICGLYGQLRDGDVLGIVVFDTQVRTVLKATRKAELPEDQLTSLVGDLRSAGGTDINMGILYGLDELSRHGGSRADLANYVYLFSDGEPTSGETNWIKIRMNIAARVRGDVTLSCFGFGFDARMRELDALAGLTGGHSTFVTHPDVLSLDLAEDLARREHLAGINIQLKIEIPRDVTVWHLYGHDLITDPAMRRAVEQEARDARRRGREEFGVDALPDLITDDTGIRIFAPDLAFGEAYWVVLEVEVGGDVPTPDFGVATVQFLDIGARENQRQRLALTDDCTIPNGVVHAHAIGLWTSEVTFYALDDLYANDRDGAKRRLSNHAKRLQSAFEHTPVVQFSNDRVIMMKLISLTDNLGQPRRWNEDIGSGPWVQTINAMSQFGMARGGYRRSSLS